MLRENHAVFLGKKYRFPRRGGGGINIRFPPKYRPLLKCYTRYRYSYIQGRLRLGQKNKTHLLKALTLNYPLLLEMYPSLLAVILTTLEESAGLAGVRVRPLVTPWTLFMRETEPLAAAAEPTGVITSLGGGVFGLGGRSETFTSMGAIREP